MADWLIADPLFCWCMYINRQKETSLRARVGFLLDIDTQNHGDIKDNKEIRN